MTSVRLWCTFLLLYLQETRSQQIPGSNQNVGFNNAMSLQQQALQKMNAMNNANYNSQQLPSFQQGTTQQNYFPQGNFQQPKFQGHNHQPRSVNWQENSQQFNLQNNIQPQGGSPVSVQMVRPNQQTQYDTSVANNIPGSFNGLGISNFPGTSLNNQYDISTKQNQQSFYQLQNSAPLYSVTNNASPLFSQTTVPSTSMFYPPTSSLAEIGSLKNQPELLSLIGSQIWQQNSGQIPNQMLVKSLQSSTPVNSQQSFGYYPTQPLLATADTSQVLSLQNQPAQMQPIVTQLGNVPAFIPVQAQPLSVYLQSQQIPAYIQQNQPYQNYIQSQQPSVQQNQAQPVEEDSSILSMILSQFPPTSPQYALASAYMPKKGSKSSLKSLIPLIINLIKEKNNCGCRNCRCHDNNCNNNCLDPPTIFGGYSNQKDYSQSTEECSDLEKVETGHKESEKDSNIKNNDVDIDSGEASNEHEDDCEDDEESYHP